QSKGTAAGYAYMQQLGKPVDLLTFGAPAHSGDQTSPIKPSDKPCVLPPTVVEVLLDTSAGTTGLRGAFGLRALDADGNVLYQKQVEAPQLDATTADYAKMQLLIQALDTLKLRLKADKAAYSLRIVQSSKNVEGWLGKHWKRNVSQVKELGSQADQL